jgi:hypothetical protein
MTKPKHERGTFVRIPLADGTFGYGRLLDPPYVAIYNYRTNQPSDDLDTIASQPVMFTPSVRTIGLKNWTPIGKRELEEKLKQPIVRFMQDIADFRNCTIYDTAGLERTAAPEECVGLERAAVWETHHVEERILDTFMGRPNGVAERMKVRLQ